MEKITFASFGIWIYAGWVGYQEFHFNKADWRLGFISLMNSLLFFCYQAVVFMDARSSSFLMKVSVLLLSVCDLSLLILTQIWIARSPHTLISALGLFTGAVNICVYIFKLAFIVVVFFFFLVNFFLEWTERQEHNGLDNFLKKLYAKKEGDPNFFVPRREIKAFFRANEYGLTTLPMLEAEKQIILRSYVRKSTAEDHEDECAICLSSFTEACFVCQLACIHRFHPDCILQWFKEKPRCPLCRKPFRFRIFRTFFRKKAQRRVL